MLSLKNGWKDEVGDIFIRYSNSNLAHDTGKSISTIKASLKELEDNDLIVRKRTSVTQKDIYVKVPCECIIANNLTTGRSENKPVGGQKAGFYIADKQATNKYKDINNISNKYLIQEGESF